MGTRTVKRKIISTHISFWGMISRVFTLKMMAKALSIEPNRFVPPQRSPTILMTDSRPERRLIWVIRFAMSICVRMSEGRIRLN